jgi:Rod binding domain-containing protein
MKVTDPLALSSTVQAANAAAQKPGAPSKETLKAAREFEQIFLRKMLSSLEKSGRAESGSSSTGNEVYSSMVVNSLAESISSAGGIGLADVIARAMTPPTALPTPTTPTTSTTPPITTAATEVSSVPLPTSPSSSDGELVFGSMRPRR